MDIKQTLGKLPQMLKKYKYPVLILLVGVVLMLWPERSVRTQQETVPAETQAQVDLARELEGILAQIRGVGKVKVLLTEAAGKQYIYQYDEDEDESSSRKDTVIVTDGDRNQSPVISQILPPSYQGAIVVCEGGLDPETRLAIVEAVSRVTGLGSDRISVLKMK